jgi:hypothetical protein
LVQRGFDDTLARNNPGRDTMAGPSHRDYGALVGWRSEQVGDRVTLHMRCVTSPPPHEARDVHSHVYMMDRQQALQLGNYLFEIAGETKPDRRGRGWWARLFG